jgi:hypothetical protein
VACKLPNNLLLHSRADYPDVVRQRVNILARGATLYTARLNVFVIRYVLYK